MKDPNDAAKVLKNGADNQWSVIALAQFDVTVNLNTMSINVQQTSTTASYKNFWIIGDATPGGWSMDSVIDQKFTQNPNNSSEYYYQGSFSAGEFKIFMGAFNDFNGSFYMPLSNHQSFSNTAAQIVTGGAVDYKWQIMSSGNYTVFVNPTANKVTITPGLILAVNNIKGKVLSVYPNPSSGRIFIQSPTGFDNSRADIFNFDGKKIISSTIINNQIDTTALKTGTYILKIDNNSDSYSAKIIVK